MPLGDVFMIILAYEPLKHNNPIKLLYCAATGSVKTNKQILRGVQNVGVRRFYAQE